MERYGRARAVYCFTPALGSLAGRAHQVQRLHPVVGSESTSDQTRAVTSERVAGSYKVPGFGEPRRGHFVAGRSARENVTCHVRDKRNSPLSDSPDLCRIMVRPSGAPMLWVALNHPSRTTVRGSSMRAVPLANHCPLTVEVYSHVRFDLIVSS